MRPMISYCSDQQIKHRKTNSNIIDRLLPLLWPHCCADRIQHLNQFEFGKKWDISVCPFGFGCLFRALTSGLSLLVQYRTCESVPLTTRMSNRRADDVGVLDDCLLVMSDRLQEAHTSFAHSTWSCTSSICHSQWILGDWKKPIDWQKLDLQWKSGTITSIAFSN